MDRLKEFEPIFYPKSMAVVGVSANEEKAGNRLLRTLMTFGFKGKLYPIIPDNVNILGLEAYPSIRDIPEPVDFVYISTPASTVPQIIQDCVAKKVPAVEIFTAGFSELNEDGRRLEQEIVALSKGKLRIIGPNCFGVYSPKGGITILPGAMYPRESGNVALLSQSGGLTTNFIWAAGGYGIRFSKAVSYGNASDINESDLLEYMASDPETKIIAAYIEGVKDGKRFFKLAKSLAGKKPLILWKGGLTKTGARAVHSHTASLGGEKAVWEGFFKQTGAVPVESFEELLDTIAIFSQLPHGAGRRVAVAGGGGAVGVAASDTCEKVGLQIPLSSPEITKQLRAILPPTGTSIRNPFDVGAPSIPSTFLQRVLEIILSWNEIDALIIDRISLYDITHLSSISDPDSENRVEALVKVKEMSQKPVLVVLEELTGGSDVINMEVNKRKAQSRFLQAGIPVFPTLDRAAKALSNICSYYQKTPLRQAQGTDKA